MILTALLSSFVIKACVVPYGSQLMCSKTLREDITTAADGRLERRM
jgi:hypothetical protein